MEAQLKTFEDDMHEFKNVNKKYRDQLIKVKVGIVLLVATVIKID